MPELEQLPHTESIGTDGAASARGPGGDGTTLEIAGVDVSGDPTEAEAAALSAALAEHLRAEADAAPDEAEPRYAVDPWCLAGRLGLRSPCRVPPACRSGHEWKVAGRTTW